MTTTLVVIGAGPAGTRCAERAAARGLSVTLIGAEASLPYNRVALSKLLAGDMREADLITHARDRMEAMGITYRAGTPVVAIERAERRVRMGDGRGIGYDRLVLATGARAFRLPLPGADLPGVLMYRTLDDVRTMMDTARNGGRAVVIGGGLLGLEAAVGLAWRGMQVTVLHAVDRLMERQLDGAAANLLARRLNHQGIDVVLSAGTQAIEGTDCVTGVRLSDGRLIEAKLVVMAVGIRPETYLAREAGLTVERGIVVDDAMRTSDPHIMAIGECAQHEGVCCGLVAPALAQAEISAQVLGGQAACYAPEADATALKVAGAGVWSAGDIDSKIAQAIVYDDPDAGEYRKFLLHDNRLIGAMLYGETGNAPWYQQLISSGQPLGAMRGLLPFGRAYVAEPAL